MTDQELLQALRTVVQDEIAPVKADISGLKEDVSKLKEDVSRLEAGLHQTNLIIENKIWPAIDALGEGQQLILERLDDKVTERTESLQDQIDVHSAAIRQINRELRQLKKAQ